MLHDKVHLLPSRCPVMHLSQRAFATCAAGTCSSSNLEPCNKPLRAPEEATFHLCYSIWTVDLAYLLRRSGLAVELMTITLGANPEYATEVFYKEHLEEDGSRVEKLFKVTFSSCCCQASSAPSCRPPCISLEKQFIQADASFSADIIRCLTLWTRALKQSHVMLQIGEPQHHIF